MEEQKQLILKEARKGINKTRIFAKLKQHGITKETIKNVLDALEVKQEEKKQPFKRYIPNFPNEGMVVDIAFMDRFKKEDEPRYLYISVDEYSKKIFKKPLESIKFAKIIETTKEAINFYGATPKKIISDNGKEFNNKHFIKFCKEQNIEYKVLYTYNSQVERMILTVKRRLKHNQQIDRQTKQHIRGWTKYIRAITTHYNNQEHTLTKQTPNELHDLNHEAIVQADEQYKKLQVKNKEIEREKVEEGQEVIIFVKPEKNYESKRIYSKLYDAQNIYIVQGIKSGVYKLKHKDNGKIIYRRRNELKPYKKL